ARLEELVAQQGERIARLEELVAQQGERLARLEELVAQQAARLDRHEERLARLEEAVAQLRETVAQLVEAVRELARTVQLHAQRLDSLEKRFAKISGFYYEVHYRERAGAYFGRLLKRTRGLHPNDLEEEVENHLTDEERAEFYLADVVVRGNWIQDGQPVFFVMEVSETVDANDVVRAIRRAELLRKAGLRAVPAVAGEDRNSEALELATDRGVLIVTNGRLENLELVVQSLSTTS
ncbi:MAG: hypothetical protein RMK92_05080, partial [Armatimonadota bacterium]|nr:hypothetical protein [Armatimonadota bacterium]